MVLGIDEAGRGPIAGPILIAGVILPDYSVLENDKEFHEIRDSKKLSPGKREDLYLYITRIALYKKIVCFSSGEIDRSGISEVLNKGIVKILEGNILPAETVIFDGKHNPVRGEWRNRITMVIKADDKIKEVAAASILAKVARDRIMGSYAKIFSRYNFRKNKGYPTKEHIDCIKKNGYCAIHRKSYFVKELAEFNLYGGFSSGEKPDRRENTGELW